MKVKFLNMPIISSISFWCESLVFFNDFFYLFAEVNASDYYVIYNNKPKYGPYHGPKATLEISLF